MKTRSKSLGWLVLLCAVGVPSLVVGCGKKEQVATAPSATASAAAASAAPTASASATDSAAAAEIPALEVPSTTAPVPTPQDFEQHVQTAVTTESLDQQLNALEKQIEGK
jgi:hypothetical protein